jgi:hypothetical protein
MTPDGAIVQYVTLGVVLAIVLLLCWAVRLIVNLKDQIDDTRRKLMAHINDKVTPCRYNTPDQYATFNRSESREGDE